MVTQVILEAFNRKLRSDPIDWPLGIEPPEIRMALDMDHPTAYSHSEGITMEQRMRVGRFVWAGKYIQLKGGKSASVYTLVEVMGG